MMKHTKSDRQTATQSATKQRTIHPGDSARVVQHEQHRASAGQAMPHSSSAEQLLRMITGYWVSAAIYVAAKLGVADLLKDGPQDVRKLAERTQTHEPSLYRVLRALASVGIFAEGPDRHFALTPLAELLRGDVPGSQRAFATMIGAEVYHCFGSLLDSVRSGGTVFEKLYGAQHFPYLDEHPEKAAIFDQAMEGIGFRQTVAMLDAYDFSGVRVLADIGGGNGSLLCAVLKKYPQMRGMLFDLPTVVERAKARIKDAGLLDRCQVAGGDFLTDIPKGADAYLMRHILHGLDDEKATHLLRSVHRVMAGGRLLVLENVIQPGNQPALGKLLDLTMLVVAGGQERTEAQYRRLFEAAGFRLTRIVPTSADLSVVEAEPVA